MQNVRNILLSIGAAVAGTKLVRTISDLEMDDVLAPVGLARRRSHVAADLALLTTGMLVGGAVALIFAPMSGRETRQRLSRKADELGGAAANKLRELKDEVRPRLGNAAHMGEHTHQ
ncbi:MAG TPA: YtxH domain-containing protein [Polyangiaceae bacterium]|jgi:hypothetical protein|nr:YtxH domain-containing protein [Polyangiaceae bacterium]